jgi:DNA polymerase-4
VIRRIMHVDMDAFYAAVEQADHPHLKGKPVIVGGSVRGVVSAASYEARKFGVHSAMPVFQARRLCPDGVFMPVRMERYKEVSRQVMEILDGISPLVEQISIDEAYIDISGTEGLHGSPRELAQSIKRAVHDRTFLTCSIGIAPNKLLAKIASDMNKPDGLTLVEESGVSDFLRSFPISRIPGIGAKTSLALKELGVNVPSDVLRFSLSFWTTRFGKYGAQLYEKAQGIDPSPVVPHSDAKSCSAEDTFAEDTADMAEILKWLMAQAESVGRELRQGGARGKTITLKVKFADFKVITRSRTLNEPTHCTQVIFDAAAQLLRQVSLQKRVRLVGVRVSNLDRGLRQAALFADSRVNRNEKLDRAMDEISQKFGNRALKRGRLFEPQP